MAIEIRRFKQEIRRYIIKGSDAVREFWDILRRKQPKARKRRCPGAQGEALLPSGLECVGGGDTWIYKLSEIDHYWYHSGCHHTRSNEPRRLGTLKSYSSQHGAGHPSQVVCFEVFGKMCKYHVLLPSKKDGEGFFGLNWLSLDDF